MAEFKRTQRDYPLSFKIAVVKQIGKDKITDKQAQIQIPQPNLDQKKPE